MELDVGADASELFGACFLCVVWKRVKSSNICVFKLRGMKERKKRKDRGVIYAAITTLGAVRAQDHVADLAGGSVPHGQWLQHQEDGFQRHIGL